MDEQEELVAELLDPEIRTEAEGRTVPVREMWFRHYPRRSWTIRNGTKEVLFIRDLQLQIKEVTPETFPRYTDVTLSGVWGTVVNRGTFFPELEFYARPDIGGPFILLYKHTWDGLEFTCGGGEYRRTRRWDSKNYIDEIARVDIVFPKSFTMSDPPCDE